MNFAADCMWDILATNYNRGFFPGVKAGRVWSWPFTSI